MSSILTINGVAYPQSSRRSASLLVDGRGWDVDGDFWLEFSEFGAGPQPQFNRPYDVSLALSVTPFTVYFTGQIASIQPAWNEVGRTWGYRCLGLKYLANWIPVTAADGSGYMRFNVSPTNPSYYVASMAGQSVGQIISYCLGQHSTQLAAIGVTTDGTTASGLAALTLVPSDEVDVTGERLWSAMESVLQRWARNVRLIITPLGLVRAIDITRGTAETLTCGTDPIDPPLFSRAWTSCATNFTVRGRGLIEPGYVQTMMIGGVQSFTPAWTNTQQDDWTYAAWTDPAGATDSGTVTTVNSSTQVTVRSSNALETWATNYWNGIQAWIYLTNSGGSGVTYTESRPITACSSMSAGGTATITLAYALSNSSSGAYDGYSIIGTNVPLSSGGLGDVWRLYDVTDPGALIADHMVPNFPVSVPFISFNGQSAILTTSPECQIVTATGAGSAQFQVMPNTGQVLFVRPVVEQCNSIAVLNAGGSNVVAPVNIYMLLPYSRGALETTYPSSGYAGTAYTQAGLERTGYCDVYSWGYAGNATVLNDLAQMLQASLGNTQVEGTVHYRGLYATMQDPSGGYLLSIAGNGYTTGDEALGIPVRAYTVRYLNDGMGGLNYETGLRCSNRQEPRTGESQYTHLSVLGSGPHFKPFEMGLARVGGGKADFVGATGFRAPSFDEMGAAAEAGAFADQAGADGGGGPRASFKEAKAARQEQDDAAAAAKLERESGRNAALHARNQLRDARAAVHRDSSGDNEFAGRRAAAEAANRNDGRTTEMRGAAHGPDPQYPETKAAGERIADRDRRRAAGNDRPGTSGTLDLAGEGAGGQLRDESTAVGGGGGG
jgi:hypothetical protein